MHQEKKDNLCGDIRLNRYLAQCGLGARRKCDELIAGGHIMVNGKPVKELGTKVAPNDKVEYRGKSVTPLRRPEYYAYYKPRGIMVTKTDPEGRPTLFDALGEKGFDARHLNYIGRLDYLSEGLLLLTSDGALIHALTHPRYHIKKVYNVHIDKKLGDSDRDRLLGGVESEGQLLRAGGVKKINAPGNWYEVDLYEGKNRQIRRMFEALSYQVLHLLRTKFAAVKLSDLEPGAIRPLTEREVAALKAVGFPGKETLMKPTAMLFDLDGTLLDTLEDIANAMNAALAAFNAPPHDLQAYRRFVGEGLDTLAARALPPALRNETDIARCVAAMRAEYATTWARATRPYDGIPELLAELRRRSIRCAVLSNKAHEFTKAMVSHFFGDGAFELVLGAGTLPKKPDPTAALHIAKTFAVAPGSFLYLGDSDVDMKTAAGAGMFPIGALWGFRSKEELLANGAKAVAERPLEVLGYLGE